MTHALQNIREAYLKRKAFCNYLLISVTVTFADVLISYLMEFAVDKIAANTTGMIGGFILQYFLTAKHVYNYKNLRSFLLFLATFLLGLVLANGIVYVSRVYLFQDQDTFLAFLVSKGLSIVFPFFVTYFLRKKLIAEGGGAR